MDVKISARHMDLTPAIDDYIHKKIQRIHKYFSNISSVSIVLECEKYRRTAQIILHVAGTTFRAKETSIDLYAAFDCAADTMDMQLKRYKEKLKQHHGVKKPFKDDIPVENAHTEIAKRSRVYARSMPIEEAISLLEKNHKKMVIFQDLDTHNLNILSKRNKKFDLTEILFD